MQTFFLVAIFCFTSSLAMPFETAEDEYGEQYYLVPSRVRRDLEISRQRGPGTRVTLGHGGTLLDNDRHHLDGSAFASKNFRPSGPLTVGGQLDYLHKPSGSSASLGAQNTRGFGTDVSANGNLNLLRSYNGMTTLDANGRYSRHFGGPYGTGRPDYYGGLTFTHRF